MKFSEWLETKLLIEIKVKCNDCEEEQGVSNYDWQGGKARCKKCGGSVEKVNAGKEKKPPKNLLDPSALRPGGYSNRGSSTGRSSD